MQTFLDSKQKRWILDITVFDIERVRDRLQIDLLSLLDPVQVAMPEELRGRGIDGTKLVTLLSTDPVLLANVILVIARTEDDEPLAAADRERLQRGFGAGGMERAATAFWEEMRRFFDGLGRDDLSAVVAAHLAIVAAAVAEMGKQIRAETFTGATGGASSGTPPASLASTRAGTPTGRSLRWRRALTALSGLASRR